MRKLILIISLAILSVSTYAQGFGSGLIKMGYDTKMERFGVGFEGRYHFSDHLRIAPDVIYYFPKGGVNGLDVNGNFHYVLGLSDVANLYPIAGIGIVNNGWNEPNGDGKTKRKGSTDIGFNLGLGFEYNLSDKIFALGEYKYKFNDNGSNSIMIGIGYRFSDLF